MINIDSSKELNLLKMVMYLSLERYPDFIFIMDNPLQLLKDELYNIDKNLTASDYDFNGVDLVKNFDENEKCQQFENCYRYMDKQEYIEYIKSLIIKISYYLRNVNCTILDPTDSDINDIANEVLCVNKGLDELKKEAPTNIYARYEIVDRCFNTDLNRDDFYKLSCELADLGHKNSIVDKAWCTYYGMGVDDNAEEAIQILVDLLKESRLSRAIDLLATIYEENGKIDQAKNLFSQIADIDSKAKFHLGNIYMQEYEATKDITKKYEAIKLIEEAAKAKSISAIEYFIDLYHKDNSTFSKGMDEYVNNQINEQYKAFEESAEQADIQKQDYIQKRSQAFESGLSEDDKKILNKQRTERTVEQTEAEISEMYKKFHNMFYSKELTNDFTDTNFFMDIYYTMLGGDYICTITPEMNMELRIQYSELLKKVRKGIEFSGSFAPIYPPDFIQQSNALKNLDFNSDNTISEETKQLHKAFHILSKEYLKIYADAFREYIDGTPDRKLMEQLDSINQQLETIIHKMNI